jgi:hypothetical protein
MEMLQSHFVLTEDQQAQFQAMMRDNQQAMREQMQEVMREQIRERFRDAMGGLRRREGPGDPAARDRIGAAMRQLNEEMDEQNAKGFAQFLAEEQKGDFTKACAAMDGCKKKTEEAEEACRKKVVEILGEEKANAVLGAPPPPAGRARPPERRTDF